MAATWKQSITTNAGIALMNKAYGVSSIIPTKAVTITDNISSYSVTQLQALTTVNYNQSRKPIVISNQANTTRIGVDIDNKDVNEQYDYYGIGIYFKQVSTGEEVLFSVIALTDAATIIPNQNGVATSSISIDAYSSIVPGTKVDLTVSDSGSITRSDVEQIVAANQSYSFPKKPLASGYDLHELLSIGISQIKDDKTVVNAPNNFSGNGYVTVVGDGTKANPITQTLIDTDINITSVESYDSDTNSWSGWQSFATQQQLATKVQDNKDGTEQLNGVQIQPFNKLTDTIGGRNLLIGTATPVSITGNTSGNQVANTYSLVGSMTAYALYQKYGSTFTLSYDWSVTDTASAYAGQMQQQFNWNPWGFGDITVISSSNTSGHRITTFTLSNGSGNTASGLEFDLDNVPTTSTITVSNMKLEKGSIATDWTPAPEDKADDSKVAHLSGANNFDTVPTVNNTSLVTIADLSSGLATKADTSAIDPSVMAKSTLTANDDVLTLADGIYRVWGTVPKNIPAIGDGSGSDWGYITVKSTNKLTRWVNFYSVSGNSATNILSGSPATWGGWRVPNSSTMASKTDLTTAVNAVAEAKVNTADTSNWQKSKITADNGGPLVSLISGTDDLTKHFQTATVGVRSIYVQAGVTNSPAKDSLKGIEYIQGAGYGGAFLTANMNENRVFWNVRIQDGTVTYTPLASDTDVTTAISTKQDKLSYVPADDSKVAHLSGENNFDTVPTVNNTKLVTSADLSSELATKADTSSIDPSVLAKTALTANDDVLTLSDGMYRVWGPVPKNMPNIGDGSGSDWGYITVKSIDTGTRWVTFSNVIGNSATNILSGSPTFWSGWKVPNSNTMASKTDLTTAISTATANMADTSKATNFTAGLQSGGVDVATAADLKSIEDASWRPLKLVSSTSGTILFKDNGDGTASLTGSAIFNVAPDKDNFVAEIDAPDGYVFTSVDWKVNIDSPTQIIGIRSQYAISATGSSPQQALKVKIQDGNLLIGGSNSWNQNNLITFNAFTTNLKTVSLAGSPATIGITKSN